MADKVMETLVAALRQARDEPGEQRLYRSGKLAGLFAGRTGAAGEAAGRAVRDGLLDVVRTETRGKVTIEWVRLGARGAQFLLDNESPVRALEDLRETLRVASDGVPEWLSRMQSELHSLGARLADDAQLWLVKLDALGRRVDEALRRVEADSLQLPDGTDALPWAKEALAYLERRRASTKEACPLPELFAAVREGHAMLSVTAFHEGLRLLQRRRVLRLTPFNGRAGELPEPEYALLDGADVLYFAERT